MSTETPVASVPAVDQPIEVKVNEETHAVKEGNDSPPPKNDEQKDEKEDLIAEKSSERSETSTTKTEETPENNQTESPIVVEDQKVYVVPVEASSNEVENADQNPEASAIIASPSEVVERQADESPTIEAVEDVPVEKSAVESVENKPVEKIEIEPVEEEAEKAQTIKADENKADEKPAIEQVEAVEKEADENKPVETEAIKEVEREAEKAETIEGDESKHVETTATEAVEKEAEKTQAIEEDETKTDEIPAIEQVEAVEKEADENKPVETEAINEVEREAEKGETIEGDDIKHVETIATEGVEKEAEKTQAIEEDETKPDETPAIEPVEKQIDGEKPKVEAFEANPSTEAVGESEEPLKTSPVKDSESVNGVESKPHEQLKDLLEIERNIEKEVKPEENVATDSSVPATEEAQPTEKEAEKHTLIADAEKPVAEIIDKEPGAHAVDETVVSENAAEKEEMLVKQETEEKKSENGNGVENAAEVADRDLVEAKEVIVKEDEYKDIKENEVVVPSATDETLKADNGNKLEEKTEAIKNEPKTDAGQIVDETSKDEAKQDVSVKAAHKQSGGIISKVKQSIVKVKKAIIGKSPSSKVLSPEVKAEPEQVK